MGKEAKDDIASEVSHQNWPMTFEIKISRLAASGLGSRPSFGEVGAEEMFWKGKPFLNLQDLFLLLYGTHLTANKVPTLWDAYLVLYLYTGL